MSAMVDVLRGRLMAELPGYGRHLGYDGKAVPSESTGRRNAETGRTSGLGKAPDPRRGREDRAGLDEGEDMVRLRSAPGGGRGARAAGVVRGGAGFALGAEGAVGRGGWAVRLGAVAFGGLRGPGAGRGAAEGEAVGRAWDPPLIDVRDLWREEKRLDSGPPRSRTTTARLRNLFSLNAPTARTSSVHPSGWPAMKAMSVRAGFHGGETGVQRTASATVTVPDVSSETIKLTSRCPMSNSPSRFQPGSAAAASNWMAIFSSPA